ncbi:hypothetical protein Pfo_012313 [Paulownia fortunei]|nr:hypothetical protein Pfo_012313 [Paulownia fortunei]
MDMPVLDEQDQKSYETIQKIIEAVQVERLKVEQCKIYLRKHGLRLSGNKETLILRIKEHIDVVNGGGEKKYPASSFVLNCKGDACMGDIVMFEQNVYEMFNIASRSANGRPPCGTRVVAGRIVKESYGAAKQQHTFTIEVLWSKGEKPLPPLHPLLIKGRNLYRLKTMRQKWEDEGERQKILSEKHARGGVARLNKEARIQQREMRKMHKPTRATRNELPNGKQEEKKRVALHSVSVKPEKLINQPKQQQQQQDLKNTQEEQDSEQKIHCYTRTCNLNFPIQPENLYGKPNNISNAHALPECIHQRQPLISMNCSFGRGQHTSSQSSNFDSSKIVTQGGFHEQQHMKYRTAKSPIRGHSQSYFPNSNHLKSPLQRHTFEENIRGESNMNLNRPIYSQQGHVYHRQNLNAAGNPPVQGQGYEQKQTCRYYVQRRCFFGDRCKYLHELAGKKL